MAASTTQSKLATSKQAETKHLFVTGGVASSLGKGLTASSLGRLLRMRGLRVSMQKLDPYLNVDPGTMNPFQHGEVFVTDDGTETDLDVGHYERFLDTRLRGEANVTTGQVYSTVIAAEPGVQEALVVAHIQVSLGAVVGDEDLAVLERVHRSRVDVEVGVQLLHRDPQAAHPEEPAEAGSGQALA